MRPIDEDLYDASKDGDLEKAKHAIEKGANVEAADDVGSTPLHMASHYGHEAVVSLLLRTGANVNAKDIVFGWTPLHKASMNGDEAIASLLLVNGAEINAKNNDGRTPLHAASANGHEAVISLLFMMKKGADVHAKNKEGWMPLHYASSEGHEATVSFLLEKGADPTITNNNGMTPSQLAQEMNKENCVTTINQFLQQEEQKQREEHQQLQREEEARLKQPQQIDKDLLVASENGDFEKAKRAIETGADVNAQDEDGMTPLHFASLKGRISIVSLLLGKGVNIEAKATVFGSTPLHNASCNGYGSIVSLLLEKGADIEAKTIEGNTPLHWASQNGKEAVVSFLLQSGANVNAQDEDGESPLHFASSKGHGPVVSVLLKSGANVNMRNKYGETPLHLACYYGYEAIVSFLLEKGADPTITNNSGKTPLQLAQEKNEENCVTAIEQFLQQQQQQQEEEEIRLRRQQQQEAATKKEQDEELRRQQHQQQQLDQDLYEAAALEKQKEELKRQQENEVVEHRRKEEEEFAKKRLQEAERKQKEETAKNELSRHQQKLAAIKKPDFANIRKQLRLVMEKKKRDPVEVSSQYIHEIDTYEPLGKGFFGIVSKGYDSVLGVAFALKKVDIQVFENASPTRIEGILNSFQNEMNILSKLDHPNIASLYGFYFDRNDMTKMCLIYELASNGSLDGFWRDDHQRRRLSNGRTRVRIAYEVAMVLRYMHEGLDWEAVCFHRDIKSANVCLDADFTVRVIDCGLSKYIEESEESFSSAGGIGTKGYICPDYNDGEINYESSCDVFSYGVFLCELITGKTSPSGRHGHYIAFEKKKTKALIDNVDATVEWDDDTCGRLVELALECIKSHSERRPTIGNVVERLHKIVYSDNMPNDDSVCTGNHFLSDGPKCRICGREGTKSYHCFGSTKHVHCGECLEDGLVRSMVRGEPHKFCCLKEGCDSRDFLIEEVEQYISRHTLVLYSLSSTMAGLKSMLHSMSSSKNESVGNTLRLQAQLCAGNGLPCPRRFILIEADRDGVHPWRNPREWLRNAKCVNLFLYFVCSHSNELVSDESRIKLRYTYEDLMKIAPAYNASLYLLQQTTAIVTGAGISLDSFKLKQMDEWSRELLDPTDRDVLDRARANGNMMKDSDARQLIGPSLSLIAEKAVEKENLSWRRELTEALDFQEKEATFIKRDYQLESRYREWHKQPSHQLGVAGAPNPERVWPQRPPMTDAIQRILTCPISGEIMQDPVILFPSGKTYDRKSICTWLLRNPTPRDPWTNEPLDRHMTYVENREIRETLIYYLGEEAYKQYDDADFKLRYKALWNAHHVESLFNVGVSYQDDDQFDVAVEYYEQAAAEGHAGAQYNLAMLNEDNHERMLRYLEQAAAQDHPDALFYLGSLYYSSDVVPQDLNRAQEYFQRAAAQGNNEALEALRDLPESTNVDEGHE